jgi:coenzyme F420 hydrogenase subunit beta
MEAIQLKSRGGVLTVDFDNSHCRKCGTCTKACPSLLNFNRVLPQQVDTIGRIETIFFGYATDEDVRCHAASGGTATSLLLYMLRRRIVDRVLVVRMNKFTVTSCLTCDPDDVISAQGSVYFKTFSLSLLRKILSSIKKGERICIVGLPCQISGLKRVLGHFNDRLYFLGLICNHVNELWFLEYLFQRFLPDNSNPLAIGSRKDGWPGGIKILFTLGHGSTQEVSVPLYDFWRPLPSLGISAPLGCSMCADHFATMADVVVGDAWHPKFTEKSSLGVSVVITRTIKGRKLVESAVEDKQLSAEKAKLADLFVTHGTNIVEGSQYAPFKQKLLRHNVSAVKELWEMDKSIIAVLTFASHSVLKHRRIRRLLSQHLTERVLYRTLWYLWRYELIRLSRIVKGLAES